jgi:hypothetical protein
MAMVTRLAECAADSAQNGVRNAWLVVHQNDTAAVSPARCGAALFQAALEIARASALGCFPRMPGGASPDPALWGVISFSVYHQFRSLTGVNCR